MSSPEGRSVSPRRADDARDPLTTGPWSWRRYPLL
jgi:hypothetical protein